MYDMANSGARRIVVSAPRSFAKSTVFSKIYPLYLILMSNRKKIYIFSSTATLAEHWLREIKRELTENKYILADFGDVTTEKWTQDHIICNVDGRKVELRARGAGAQTRGWRPDTIILDDIDDDEAVMSEDRRVKLRNWYNKELVNTLEYDGQLVMVGTVIHPLALLVDVMGREGYLTVKYQAILPDGTSLWEEKWPIAALHERRREIGMLAFNSEYMNDPAVSENPIFVRQWMDAYEADSESFKKVLREGVYTVMTIDPAISRKETADYSAIVTLSATKQKNPKIYVRVGGVIRGHWPLNKQVLEMDVNYRKFGASEIVIETTAYQQALADEFKLYCEEMRRFPKITEIKPDRDKERRAHAVAPMMERGQVFFDHEDVMTQKLMDEMFMFPTGDRDDLVDAFVYALDAIRKWARREFNDQQTEPNVVLPGKGRRSKVTGVIL